MQHRCQLLRVRPIVVVAEDRKGAQAAADIAEQRRQVLRIVAVVAEKIAGEEQQVRRGLLDPLHDQPVVGIRQHAVDVQVGDVRDAQARAVPVRQPELIVADGERGGGERLQQRFGHILLPDRRRARLPVAQPQPPQFAAHHDHEQRERRPKGLREAHLPAPPETAAVEPCQREQHQRVFGSIVAHHQHVTIEAEKEQPCAGPPEHDSRECFF